MRDNSGFLSGANHFLLESCPLVRSKSLLDLMLKRVDLVLFGCRTHFHILSGTLKCDITCDELNKFYASRVSQHVPVFKNKFAVIPGVPAAVDPVDIEVVTPPDT